MQRRHLLIAGESRGTLEVLAPIAGEALAQGHEVRLIALGTAAEAVAFSEAGLAFEMADQVDLAALVASADVIVSGHTGKDSREADLYALAKGRGIASFGVLDNIDHLDRRLSGDAGRRPDRIIVSGEADAATLASKLRNAFGILPPDLAASFVLMPSLRRDKALQDLARFSAEERIRILGQALAVADLPPGETASRLTADILSGRRRLAVFYGHTIHPLSPYRASYAATLPYRRGLFDRHVAITQAVLAAVKGREDVILAVRPHPREDLEPLRGLALSAGALYLPAEAGESTELAMAAGHIICTASSMIAHGVFHDVRTVAVLPEAEDHINYAPLREGAALWTADLTQVQGLVDQLMADGKKAADAWRRRLDFAGPREPAAPQVLDLILGGIRPLS